ncbi:DoxX family protein [Dawidia soli]|uniref:DoxX family protein n=1 Tax=Dawidia soli TaxID=2782352 RepID=A0AAP2DBY0_9BACT|nr:DoxX family protein [Dawidia soli]MBT1689208.1 DoxX family protein [Dawidia soli]
MTTANTSEKLHKVTYWTVTLLLCTGMFAGGVAQAVHAPWNAQGFIHLGYPLYVMTLIGLWKIAGVVVLLAPGWPLVKEWAYAGFFFVMTGAVVSHLASGDGISGVVWQTIFVILIILSWYLRPASRRLKRTDIIQA